MKRKEEFGNTNKILENTPLSKMYTGVLNQGKKIPKTRRNEHELQRKQKKALFGRLRYHGTVSVRKNNGIPRYAEDPLRQRWKNRHREKKTSVAGVRKMGGKQK